MKLRPPHLLIIASVALLVPVGYVMAKHRAPRQFAPARVAPIERLLAGRDELKLTDDQTTKLKKMAKDFKLQAIDQRASLEKAEVELRSLMNEGAKADRAEVESSIDRLADLKAAMQKMRYSQRMAVLDLLTDEQEQLIKEHRKDRMREMRAPRAPRMPGHPGNERRMRGDLDGQNEFDQQLGYIPESPELDSEI